MPPAQLLYAHKRPRFPRQRGNRRTIKVSMLVTSRHGLSYGAVVYLEATWTIKAMVNNGDNA